MMQVLHGSEQQVITQQPSRCLFQRDCYSVWHSGQSQPKEQSCGAAVWRLRCVCVCLQPDKVSGFTENQSRHLPANTASH